MWPPRRLTDRDALSRYWNALVSGAPAEELAPLAAALDDERLVTIDRLRGRQRFPPDPAFVARLERDLLRDLALASVTGAPLRTATRAGGGRTLPRAPGWSPFGAPRGWSLTPVISALLVIVALLAVYLAFIRPREAPVIVPVVAPQATPATPAVEATPAAGSTPGIATPEVPFWRKVPPPQVGATFEWELDGPASTGTGLSSQVAMSPDAHLWVLDGAHGLFQIYDKDGVLLDSWGEAGSGQGQFDFQRDNGEVVGNVSFTPLHADEPFYVADSQNARIQVFDADRKFLRTWGGHGTGDGQFLEPVNVWVSFDGRVYVVDDQRDDVQVFDTEGTFIHKFGGPGSGEGQFAEPGWGAVDDHGFYWVADTGNNRLQEFFCCDPDRDQFLEKIDGAGSPESQLERPQFMAFDKDRRLYVVDRGHRQIKVVAQDGRFANLIDGSAAGGTAFVNPEGVAVALEGLSSFLYVLDDNGTNVTVQKIRLLLL